MESPSHHPPSLRNLQKKIFSIFNYLYSNDNDYFNIKTINEIICNEPTHIVAQFKDYLIMGDYSEFIQKYYQTDQSKKNLIKVFDYYESCSVIFPNYFILPESKYLYKNIQRKQRVIDVQQEQEFQLEQKKYKKTRIELPNPEYKVFNTEVFDSLLNLTETSTIRNILGLNRKGNTNEKEDNKCNENIYEDNEDSIENIINEISKCEKINEKKCNKMELNIVNHIKSGSNYNGNSYRMGSTIEMSNEKGKVMFNKTNKMLTIYNFRNRLHNINTNTINISHPSRNNKISSSNTVNTISNTTTNTHISKPKIKTVITDTNVNTITSYINNNSHLNLNIDKTSSHKSTNSLMSTFNNSKKDLVLKVLKDIKHKHINSNPSIHHQISSSRNYSSKKIKPSILTDIELNKNYSSSSIHQKYLINDLIPKLNTINGYKCKFKDKTRNYAQINNKGLSLKTELSLTKNESHNNYYKENMKFPINPRMLEMMNTKIKKMKSLNRKEFLPITTNITSGSITGKGRHRKVISISPSEWNGGMAMTGRTQDNEGNNGEGKIKVFIPIRKDNHGGNIKGGGGRNLEYKGDGVKGKNYSNGNGNNCNNNNCNLRNMGSYTDRNKYRNMFSKKI